MMTTTRFTNVPFGSQNPIARYLTSTVPFTFDGIAAQRVDENLWRAGPISGSIDYRAISFPDGEAEVKAEDGSPIKSR